MRAEQITDAVAHHGEGPVWDVQRERLMWVDMLRGDVLSLGAEVERRHVGDVAACIAPRAGGGHVVATERGFTLLDDEVLPEVWSDPTVRMNDGGCDPHGRFWCGSMAYDATAGRGSLYRLDADHSVHRILDDVTISNGLAWSPDGATAYYIDSPTQRIDAFAYDGELHDRRPIVDIPSEIGTPDGLTIDTDGCIWVALWTGAAVHCYTPDGALDAVVELPVSQPTSCAFGGVGLDVLYITTSAQDCPEPNAGALFAITPGATGVPTLEFAG